VGLLLPDGEVNQQPGGHMHVIHDAERTGVHLRGTIVPHKVAKPRGRHAKPHQNAPLQAGGRQFLWVAEREPGDNRHHERAEIEPRKRAVLRHRMRLHQAFIAHHPDSEADIRQLYQQQPGPEVIAHFVIANNRRADNRKPGA